MHNPNIISLAQDWKGETKINLFVEGQASFQDCPDIPEGLPATFPIKLGNETKQIPCSYMWKDVLQVGSYTKHATDQELNLDLDDLPSMADTFKLFIKNGNVCPIIEKDHNEDRSLGFCLDARVKDQRLELLHQFIGEDAAVSALRNRVSPQIHKHHKDSKNNTYHNLIVHNSLTADPVIIGQRGWDSMAASRGEPSSPPLYVFAASRRSHMTIAELRALLGLGDSVADADVLKAAHARITAAKPLETANATLTTEKTQLSNAVTAKDAEIKTLRADLETKKTEVVQLSQKVTGHKPSAHELYFAKEAIAAKRTSLITAGTINAATADKIEKKFLSGVDLNTISLSRQVTDADVQLSQGLAQTMDVYDALVGGGKGPASGEERTGAQGDQKEGETVVDDKKKDDDKNKDGNKDKDKTAMKSGKEIIQNLTQRRYKGPAGYKASA